MTADTERSFDLLLEYLKRTRGFDFTGYKRSSLARRIQKRMFTHGLAEFSDYLDYLQVHPEEFPALFNTILINVTSFWRDPHAWEALRDDVLPKLLRDKPTAAGIRVWSAGCASGEETYTLTMILAELLGVEEFKARLKIYATDVDEEALSLARHASYSERELEGVSEELRARYFEPVNGRMVFRKDLRRNVIFGRHDLVQHAPISRVDLLVCRNTLMYFNAETQRNILLRFHFAMHDTGVLFLGRAESLLTHSTLFTPIDLKRRIFAKVPRFGVRERLLTIIQGADGAPERHAGNHGRIREAAFDLSPSAQLVIDPEGNLVLANQAARLLFGLPPTDLGRPLRDLEASYRPVELRSLIQQAQAQREPVVVRDVVWGSPAEPRRVDISVAALADPVGGSVGTVITLSDVTDQQRLRAELEHSRQELETAYEELQSTVEELETTNEELQSTVEELETTNEELQSTTEELETMNEELQSTNEELHAINDEVRRRSDDLNAVNAFLESILTSLDQGVVVLDRDFQVQVWNSHAEDLWGLRSDEVVGHGFLNLEFGLPVEQLKLPIRKTLAGGNGASAVTVDATNRRGRPFRCTVTLTPLTGADKDIRGVILLMNGAAAGGGGEPMKSKGADGRPRAKVGQPTRS